MGTVIYGSTIGGMSSGGLQDSIVYPSMVAIYQRLIEYNSRYGAVTVPTDGRYPLRIEAYTGTGTANALNTVNFTRAFSLGVPTIIVTRLESATTDRYSLRVVTTSTTNFTFRCTDGGDGGGSTFFYYWIAIGA